MVAPVNYVNYASIRRGPSENVRFHARFSYDDANTPAWTFQQQTTFAIRRRQGTPS